MKRSGRWRSSAWASAGTSTAARLGAGPRDDRQLVERDRNVLDEHGVGHVETRRQPLDAASGLRERLLVLAMLRARPLDVDRHARQMGQLARRHRRADVARECNEHAHIIIKATTKKPSSQRKPCSAV